MHIDSIPQKLLGKGTAWCAEGVKLTDTDPQAEGTLENPARVPKVQISQAKGQSERISTFFVCARSLFAAENCLGGFYFCFLKNIVIKRRF